jgi:protein-S-isoprenylcysteine O-methyltransferase Ste14
MNTSQYTPLLHWALWLTALVFFGLMCWVSATFFDVKDASARRGKRFVSVLAGSLALYVLYRLYPGSYFGIARSLAAWLLFVYAIAVFIAAWRVNLSKPLDFVFSDRAPEHIQMRGPYARIRHPFYSSYCAAWIASMAATLDIWIIVLGCGLIALYIWAAKREEGAFEASEHGMSYRQYRNRAGMLLPRVWRHG